MTLSSAELGAELPLNRFEPLLEATGLSEQFKKLDEPHKKSLQASFIDMAKITEANDFGSQVSLLRQIINNDHQILLHHQSGDSSLRKAAGAGK